MEVAHVDVAQRYDLDRPPPTSGWRYLTKPGWLRAIWMTALFFGLGFGLVVFIRWLAGWHPIVDWQVITVVAILTSAPIGFLAGLGAFDYWVRLRARLADAAGGPLRPRRAQLEGLLPRQHRPQGHRHPVRWSTTLLFFLSAACWR